MTISQQVENLLKASHKARNSDKELFILYMQRFGMALNDIQVETFRRMPSLETIRRVRQKIQELGKYRADEVTEKRRYEQFKQVRSEIPFTEEVDQLIEKWSNK